MNLGGIKQIRLKDRPLFCRLVYSDLRGGGLLKSEKHDLRGKPDLVFQSRFTGRPTPMELKSGEVEKGPHYGDVMQLVAYFVIVEEAMGKRPKRGFLRYKNAMFVVKNSGRRRRELFGILADMRKMLETGEGSANPSFVRCRHCLARDTVCTKK